MELIQNPPIENWLDTLSPVKNTESNKMPQPPPTYIKYPPPQKSQPITMNNNSTKFQVKTQVIEQTLEKGIMFYIT